MLRSRPASAFARFIVLVCGGYLAQVAGYVMNPRDRLILGVEGLDLRVLFVAGTVCAVVYAFEPRWEPARWAWLVLFTLAAWGRALSLLFIGTPELSRSSELAGVTSWVLIFGAGILATVVLTAGELLRHDRR